MKTSENRRAKRSKHDSVMEIFDVDGNLIVGVGRLVDFSNVGVCFASTKTLAKGDRLRARLRLLKEGVMEIAAHVVWVKKRPNTKLYGVEFDSVQKLRG
jgi:hypothetical protein